MAHGPTFLKSKVRNGSLVRFTPHMEHEGKYKVIPIYCCPIKLFEAKQN